AWSGRPGACRNPEPAFVRSGGRSPRPARCAPARCRLHVRSFFGHPLMQQLHALLDVERSADALQRQPQLDQRDGDGRLHADDDGLGIHDARKAGNRTDHPSDERIDHIQCRDIDEYGTGRSLTDPLGKIVLQRKGKLVVHVDLDGDQQEVTHPQDWYAFHYTALLTVSPERRSASASASARDALVTMPWRSSPRWTIVCAICGRTPLMMQSAPIRRIAVTVLSRCCATSVSTVGTPVMSMMAISEPVSTMRCNNDSITTWVRCESSVPIIGSARTPSQSFTTGVE